MKETVKFVVSMLTQQRYSELEQFTSGIRLSAEHMSTAVQEYGRILRMPPESAFDSIDAVRIEIESQPSWCARFHLWTAEEGFSDLSIVLHMIETESEFMSVEIDDILVF